MTDQRGASHSLPVTVAVADQNDEPAILSATDPSSAENQTVVLKIKADDEDREQALRFQLDGGPDAAKFAIDGKSGELSFRKAPNYERPTDADKNNVYEVAVMVRDSAGASARKSLRVRVADANDDPVFTFTPKVKENELEVLAIRAQDEDAKAGQFKMVLVGGEDKKQFAIDVSTGDLSFKKAPNFEKPNDKDRDNVYEVRVRVEDADGGASVQSLFVTVTDSNDPPQFKSPPKVTVDEQQSSVLQVKAVDEDSDSTKIRFALVGGDDLDHFRVNRKTGKLQFRAAPDFEKPADENGDNLYEVEVQAEDESRTVARQMIRVQVADVQEAAPESEKPQPAAEEKNDEGSKQEDAGENAPEPAPEAKKPSEEPKSEKKAA